MWSSRGRRYNDSHCTGGGTKVPRAEPPLFKVTQRRALFLLKLFSVCCQGKAGKGATWGGRTGTLAGFSPLAQRIFGVGSFCVVTGAVLGRVLSSSPRLYPLDASRTPLSRGNQQCLQPLPRVLWGQSHTWLSTPDRELGLEGSTLYKSPAWEQG